MIRQFYKVKQLYDENIKQGEKTELLSSDFSQVGKNVDLIKTTLVETRKKVRNSIGVGIEDNNKKGPNTSVKNHKLVLGQTLMEISSKYTKDSLLYTILNKTGQTIASLAVELSTLQMGVDDEVLQKLNSIIDVDIENIDKQKKKLSKVRLDLDTAKLRYVSVQKQNPTKDKLQNAESELNELAYKFENIQDTYITELLKFVSKEKDYALLYTRLLEMEMDFHRNSLEILTAALPEVRKFANTTVFQPVFGISLEQHHEIFGKEISFVVEECCNFIHENGIQTEGIFRLAGSSIKIKKIKAAFDAGLLNLKDDFIDPISLAGVMKQYLRELPEPILTHELENEFIAASSLEMTIRKNKIKALIQRLPPLNYKNLEFLIRFLRDVADESELNKMSPSNLGIVVGPNLLWSREEEKNLICTSAASYVTECLIENYAEIFEIKSLPKLPVRTNTVGVSMDEITAPQDDPTKDRALPIPPRKEVLKVNLKIGNNYLETTTSSPILIHPMSRLQN